MKDRSVLLPPYMEDVPVWQDLMSIIDNVFAGNVDDPTMWLNKLRFLWIQTTTAIDKVNAGQLLSAADFELPEKEILIKQAKQLGFDFKETNLIEDGDYQRIVRNIALYWYSKGKPDFIDFLGFVLNKSCQLFNLWSTTNDAASWKTYGTFLEEGDPGIGTPVWQGGTWYPTTHVRIRIDPFGFVTPKMAKLVNLFYTIANYNLVLESVQMEGTLNLHSIDTTDISTIVVTYPVYEIIHSADSL